MTTQHYLVMTLLLLLLLPLLIIGSHQTLCLIQPSSNTTVRLRTKSTCKLISGIYKTQIFNTIAKM
ncbi:hypothetical protein MANES_07G072614v8 [Manihot esculenta]|uniref:Uncharacterized protein n=1 Tax=Manihot esculenta TaxID=3983 RepID=A0ACB7HDT8_MANES|nr:hypothetical protein MANES_07G072614v8 [Manihot esculenta]